MEGLITLLLYLFFLVAMIGLVLYVAKLDKEREKKRRNEIKAYCSSNGLKYNDIGFKFLNIASGFALANMNRGSGHQWLAEVYGKRDDLEFYIIDHSYITGSGKSRHLHHDTLCLIRDKNINIPCFYARTEDPIFDTIGKIFGGQDINFSEDKKFSSKFVLQGPVEADIRKFFTEPVRKAFVDFHHSSYQYESRKNSFLVMNHGLNFLNLRERMIFFENSINIFNSFYQNNN